ncbi:MAG: hypothetical protein ACO3ZY_08760, partial [Phycisphaerales bacterium]
MSDSRDALDLREPGLADVLGDVDALSLWELLRRSGQALDADELAARARMRLAVVQERRSRLAAAPSGSARALGERRTPGSSRPDQPVQASRSRPRSPPS